jgi:hypothetical protein
MTGEAAEEERRRRCSARFCGSAGATATSVEGHSSSVGMYGTAERGPRAVIGPLSAPAAKEPLVRRS